MRNATSHTNSTTSPSGAAASNSPVKTRKNFSLDQAASQFRKHAMGITFTPFAAAGGLLYAASIVGPLHHGLKDNLADYSAQRRQVALQRRDQNSRDQQAYRPPSSFSSLLSVVREFAAPFTWAMRGYKTGYNFVQ